MKKITALVLAVLMVLALASTAFAVTVTADYDKETKVVTVSVSDYGNGMYEIYIDGSRIPEFVGVGFATNAHAFKNGLGEGEHSVSIFDPATQDGAGTTFYVAGEPTTPPTEEPSEEPTVIPTDAPTTPPTEEPSEEPTVIPTDAPTTPPTEEPSEEPTAIPTDVPTTPPTEEPVTGPIKIESVDYANRTIFITVSGLRTQAELWIDGNYTGTYINANGSFQFSKHLDDGQHKVLVFCPEVNEMDTAYLDVKTELVKVSAEYPEVGKLVYSVDSISNENEVWLDGAFTGAFVNAPGTYTLSVELEEGNHLLYLFDPQYHIVSQCDFVVTHIPEVVPGYDATCTEDGLTDGSKCAICGIELEAQEVIPAKGHTAEVVPGKEATCEEEGLTDGEKCSVCGEELKAQEPIPAKGHTAEVVPGKEATCEEEGLTDGEKCSVCGKELKAQEAIPAKGHTAEAIPAKAPTCEEEGLTEGEKCSVCGKVLKAQEAIPATGHTVEKIPGVEPTCTKTGLTEGEKCSVCGKELKAQEVIRALAHNYVKTSENARETVYTCTRCGDTYVMATEKPIKNLYGSILKDANGVNVDYTAIGKDKVLEIVADLSNKTRLNLTDEVGMYLTQELIDQFVKEGFISVSYTNAEATLIIDLSAITKDWFATDQAIKCFVFSTNPKYVSDVSGVEVKVEAEISENEKIPAENFSGVLLKSDAGDITITANGVYNTQK